MSGCCGQGPVIVSGAAAAPRLDVETQLMCDVLPDGTVAATVLVEPIYDTSSGVRVATRITDPATGDEYTPSGTLQPCSTSSECESPTTPLTSVGLCLADGTPIAVTVVRDCTGVVTSEGWINLSTGAWSAGAPPAGTMACGDARTITVSGTFCDIDGDGEVVGLVLVEYTYDDTGAIAAVRLVDAVTGDTYVPTGTVTVCPAGVEQPERDLIKLCDTAGDGTITPFVRDYARDENGQITGHTDYGLDGAPYTPTGTVGVCIEPCRTSSTLLLCDEAEAPPLPATPAVLATDPAPYFFTGHNATFTGDAQLLWDGGTLVIPPDPNNSATGQAQVHRCLAGVISAPAAACDDGTATVTATVTVRNTGPNATTLTSGRLRLLTTAGTQLANNTISGVGVNATRTMTVTAPVTADQLTGGELVVWLDLETWDSSGSNAPPKGWEAYGFAVTAEFGQAGCAPATPFVRTLVSDCDTGQVIVTADHTLDGQPYTVTGEVGQCTPASTPDECRNCVQTVLCDATEEDGTRSFLRTVCRDCTGAVISTLDTELDGTTPYAPTGTVGSCGPDDCPTTSVQTIRLCDLNPDAEPNEEGRRCAIPFLRHLAYDCAGDLLGFHDTGLDGTTPYTPVQVVDCQCQTGQGITSSIEVPWQVVSVVEDPAGSPQQDFIYTVSPENDPSRVGTIHVHVSRAAGGACGPYDINALIFSNSATYTLTLDAVAQEMSYLRVDLADFDNFEPVGISSGTPEPDRLGGTAGWNPAHTRIVPSENNGVGYMYWDNPPETVSWFITNQGGGTSCSQLSFQGMTVEPGGCCGGDEAGCNDCAPVNTGVRNITGTAPQDLAGEFPDLQSVSLTVLAGTVNATMTDGAGVPIPAGVTLTWSVATDADTALSSASFAGADAGAGYLLNWTRK